MGYERGTIRIDQYLTGLARKYSIRDFTWSALFPPMVVANESDRIKVTNKAGYFKAAPVRSPGAPAEVGEGSYTYITYHCEEHAIKELIEDKDIARAQGNIFNLKQDAMERCQNKIGLAMEIDAMTVTTGGGISTSSPDHTVTPSTTWDNRTSSTPLEDIATGKRMIKDAIGREPNVIFMSSEVEEKLSIHPEITAQYQGWSETMLTKGNLPPTIKGMRVVVSNAVYNSADQGATVTFANIWRRHCILAYVNPVDTVNFGRMLIWRATNMETRTWRDDEIRGQWIEVANSYVPIIVTGDAAYWFQNVIA